MPTRAQLSAVSAPCIVCSASPVEIQTAGQRSAESGAAEGCFFPLPKCSQSAACEGRQAAHDQNCAFFPSVCRLALCRSCGACTEQHAVRRRNWTRGWMGTGQSKLHDATKKIESKRCRQLQAVNPTYIGSKDGLQLPFTSPQSPAKRRSAYRRLRSGQSVSCEVLLTIRRIPLPTCPSTHPACPRRKRCTFQERHPQL